MKLNLFFLLTALTIIVSCSTDESSPLDILDQAENGALIVAIETQANGISSDTAEGSLEVLLEYSDAEQGNLLDRMDVYTTFIDQSAEGDSSSAITNEVLLRSVESTQFQNGINNFPTYQMNITAQEFLNATNNTSESIASEDAFLTRLELVLTDGRTFSFLESDQFDVGVATFIFSTTVN